MEGARLPDILSFEGNVSENYRKFIQSFEIYLTAIGKDDKPDKVKIAILLNAIGPEGIEIYNSFKLSANDQKSYTKTVQEFMSYCTPRKNRTYERFVFNSRKQAESEPFDHFLSDLKKLVKSCEYDDQEESILTDRIVLGVYDRKIQEKLLNTSNITLKDAADMCRHAEMTKVQIKTVREPNSSDGNGGTSIDVDSVKTKQKSNQKPPGRKCGRCLLVHKFRNCPAWGKTCRKCGKKNHFDSACKTKQVQEIEDISETFVIETLVKVGEVKASEVWLEKVTIKGQDIWFKIDTGAQVNILPKRVYDQLTMHGGTIMPLEKTGVTLEAYGGMKIKPVGMVKVSCNVKSCVYVISFVVVDMDVRPILGLNTCTELNLVKKVDLIANRIKDKENFICNFGDIFAGLGTMRDKCEIKLKPNSVPVARPARRVPLMVRDKLESKLKELEKQKVISKIDGSTQWVSNLVIIEKGDGTLRLCLDPQALNQCIEREFYEIPTVEDISSKLSGKKYYSVLDFKDGYYQIELTEESSKLCSFSTPFGTYRFQRLPFGLNIAPEFFQKLNMKYFGDIPNVAIYFDDLLIAADSMEQHDETVIAVAERARKLNIKFNKNKLQFRLKEVKYLGFLFSREGRRIDDDRINAIRTIGAPKSKKELQSLLGVINFVRCFIPNMAELTAPLRDLLKKDSEWQWLERQDNALEKIKTEICSPKVLMNFDSSKDITIQTDACNDGLGCCLLQEGRPVCFASRGLTDTEKQYAIIEKELLGVLYAVHKFHQYVYGRSITVITDHKPNVSVMEKNISQINSARLQRIRLKLLKYNIKMKYLPGKHLHIPDYLSRHVSNETPMGYNDLNEVVHSVEKHFRMSKEKKVEFKKYTDEDQTLKSVKEFCVNGWGNKDKLKDELKPYYKLRSELQVINGLLFFGDRVVVPSKMRESMLKLLHEGHFGVNRTQDRAREVMYWPGVSKDIKEMIEKCPICEKYRSANIKEPLILHEMSEFPFQKIAADICQVGQKDYLVVIDYLTKWLEVVPLQNKQSTEIIRAFKQIFATFGTPDVVVSDNMPFSSWQCKQFASEWNFKFETSSPTYPRSNGLAERAVQISKNIIKKSSDMYVALMEYRNTPITGLKRSPAQLLFLYRQKTKLPVLTEMHKIHHQYKVDLEKKREKYKFYYDRHTREREQLKDDEDVVIKKDQYWEPARIVTKHQSPRSYLVQNKEGRIVRRNSYHMKKSCGKYREDSEVWEDEGKNVSENENSIKCKSGLNNSENVVSYSRGRREIKLPIKYKDYVM